MPEAGTALELLAKTGLKHRGLAWRWGGETMFESFAAIGEGLAKRFSDGNERYECNFFYLPHNTVSNN